MDIENEMKVTEIENGVRSMGKRSDTKDDVLSSLDENSNINEEDKFDFPDFFIDDKKLIRVEIDVVFDPTNGRPRILMSRPNAIENNVFRTLKKHKIWADFSQPSFNDMTIYRETCLSWNEETKQFLTDPIKMRLHYLRYHLKNWNVSDNKGVKTELEFDEETKGLSNKSMSKISNLSPAILDILLTEFEKEALLI